MRTGFTIGHLSDLHIDVTHHRANIRNTKRVLEYMSRVGIDHLVVTGDIAADADPKALRVARNLFESYGFLSPERLSVIVGNHDIFGGFNAPDEILGFPSKCRRTHYLQRMRDFHQCFAGSFAGCLRTNDEDPFPFVKDLGVAVVIGMNSIAPYSSVINPVGSNGMVEERDLKLIRKHLDTKLYKHKQKIVLIHHHFNKMISAGGGVLNVLSSLERQTMKLWRKKAILEFLGDIGAGLVLHGHDHVNLEYSRKGIKFLNGGASVLSPSPEILHANFVHVTDDRVTTEMHAIPAMKLRQTISVPAGIGPDDPAGDAIEEAA